MDPLEIFFDYNAKINGNDCHSRILIVGTNLNKINKFVLNQYNIGYINDDIVSHYIADRKCIVRINIKYNITRNMFDNMLNSECKFTEIHIFTENKNYEPKFIRWLSEYYPNVKIYLIKGEGSHFYKNELK